MGFGHSDQRFNAMSRIPQTNYATPTAPVTTNPLAFVEVPVKDQNFAAQSVNTEDNRAYATGVDFATDQWLLSHDATLQKEFDVNSDTVGRILYAGLGSVVTTTPDAVGAPTARQHVVKHMDANVSRQLPAWSFVEQVLAAGLNRLLPSCVCESFFIRGAGIRRIEGGFTLRGSGKETSPSGVDVALDTTNEVQRATNLKYFFNNQVNLTVADAGTLTNAVDHGAVKRIETWNVGWENQLIADDGYRPGISDFQTPADPTSGVIRSEALFGTRRATIEFLTRMDSASNERAALKSQAPLDVNIFMQGPTIAGTALLRHSLRIRAVLSKYEAAEIGNQNGILTVAIRPKPLYKVDTGDYVTFTLVNETTSYTT